MVLEICDNITVLEIIRIIQIAMKVVKIAVPIILIVTIMIDFTACIKPGDEDLLNKTLKSSIKKFIAAVVIFLLPTLVSIIFSLSESDTNYCLKDKVTYEIIEDARCRNAEELIDKARSSNNLNDYYAAVSAVNNIKEESIRNGYLDSLSDIKDQIDNK